MKHNQGLLVRCGCGCYLRRREDPRQAGTFRWYDLRGRWAGFCPRCGVPTAVTTTRPVATADGFPVATGKGTMPLNESRRGVTSTTAGTMADETGQT